MSKPKVGESPAFKASFGRFKVEIGVSFCYSVPMSEVDDRAMAAFGSWLGSLASDAQLLSDAVADTNIDRGVRAPLAAALNYLFKSLDLIDDGIEGLGFLDDAFILRIACQKAQAAGTLPASLESLSSDAALIDDFLAELSSRMHAFVTGLASGIVRGRSVDAILDDATVREDMLGDVLAWANRYKAPSFQMDENNLVKVRAFLAAKLPA